MKYIFTTLIMTFLVGSLTGQSKEKSNFNLLISPYSRSGKNDAIAVFNFNSITGEATYKSKVTGIVNPSFIVISSDKKYVYSVNETANGTLSSFSFNPESGEIVFLNSVSSGGNGPTNITTDNQGKFVFCANYGSGGIAAIGINKDGSLSTSLQVFKYEPKPNGSGRQSGSHAHSTVFSPDYKYLMVPDLGTDKVNIYHFDVTKTSNPLEPMNPPFVDVKPGSGPRIIVFHPNGKYAYVIHEMGAMVTVFDYENGKLAEKQTVSIVSEGFTGRVGAADIQVSPDGRFLYASNRGDANELAIYKINIDGTLVYNGRISSNGAGARSFVIDPAGNFLLIGNNTSNMVSIFRINKKTGMLTLTDKTIEIEEPGCLKFVYD
jgi:6-phosphogluconolactonase